ncbi:MAG: GH92 family glycosyl hydrolase [Proteiniphilum sp.]|nr:GH92 family glycosyl hydrolase [Proteiniphilum sp.]
MTYKLIFLPLLCLLYMGCAGDHTEMESEYAVFVNPFIGASTSMDAAGVYHGLGKTFPGAATPFGMVQVSPNSITGGDNGSGYSYEHQTIEGFAMTQMSGVGWNGDLGNFLVMPTTGGLMTHAGTEEQPDNGYRSRFSKETERAEAGYYTVQLDDYHVKAEMTATQHCGIFRFTYPEHEQSRIQIDLARRVGGTSTWQQVKVVDEQTITGSIQCPPEGGGWGNGDGKADYTLYFYAQFSQPLRDYGIWSAAIPDEQTRKLEDVTGHTYQQIIAQAEIKKLITEEQGKHLGFFTNFATEEGDQIVMKVGISFVDEEGAKRNLEQEIPDWDFDGVKMDAHMLWNEALAKIKIKGGSDEQKTVFYTSLYHTMIDPRTFEDVDGRYMGGDKKPQLSEDFTKRSLFSGWDVFRSQFPLQTLINPTVVNDMLQSLITLAGESDKGYFERWELLNAYSACMIGNPAISVLADAYAKGIRGYDIRKAYEIARHTSERSGNEELGFTVQSDEVDSGSAGYAVGDFSISNTLELSYTEWCMSQLAGMLDLPEDQEKYLALSGSYRNVFDPQVGWFRARNEDGSWKDWPEKGRLQDGYGTVESNPYQQGWFVPHDVEGMVDLMGGIDKVLPDLIQFFEKVPEDMMWNDYYNHANEPVHFVPYLFNRLGVPWLTQKWTREICRRAYRNRVDGLVGNEDVGQMSAWYVLSAIGVHQACPGDLRYEITSPVFDEAEIQLDRRYAEGTRFKIMAINNSEKNIYIQQAWLNGVALERCWLHYDEIISGGELRLEMGPEPNKDWGV